MSYVSTPFIGATPRARSRRVNRSRRAIAAGRPYYFSRSEPRTSTSGYVGDCGGDSSNYCDGLGFSLKPPKSIRKAVKGVGTFVKKHETALLVGAGVVTAGLLAPGAAALIARGALSAGGSIARAAAAGGRAILKPVESLITKKASSLLPPPLVGPPVPSASSGPWQNPDAYNGVWDALYANVHKRQESAANDPEFAAWAQWKASGVLPSSAPTAPSQILPMPTLTLPGQTGGGPTTDYSGGSSTGAPSYGGETPGSDQAVDASAPAPKTSGMNPAVIIGGIAALALVGATFARSRSSRKR
jgi:hypothetical protein